MKQIKGKVRILKTKKLLIFVFALLLLKLIVIIDGSLLILLVFGNKIVHIRLGLSELHLVHIFPCIPMQEGLSHEHGSELLTDSLEKLLNGSRVPNESGSHFQTSGRNVAHSSFDVVRNPFDKIAGVLILNSKHLFIDLLHRHAAPEDSSHGEIPTVPRITCRHHVLSIEHLLSEFRNSKSTILLGATGSQGSKPGHEKVQAWEWNHVHGKLSEVSVQLSREPWGGGNAGHGEGDKMVEVSIRRVGQLQSSEANIVESLIVNAISLIGVLNQLMD